VVVYYDCAGHQLPAGSPPSTCPPPKPPKPPCGCKPPPKPKFHCPVIHLVKPNPNTTKGRHGVHRFGGRCSKGKIISTTMYVTPIAPGRPPTGHPTVRLHSHGAFLHVWLYDLSIWRHHLAWGRYRLKFVFHVRFHGHVYTCVRHAKFFNKDSGGLPGRPEPAN
jgi:hypothetical protein